jgi:hypothetical protein
VTQPTDLVVLENYIRPDTRGELQNIVTRYELSERGQYAFERMPRELRPSLIDATLPSDLQQARHAVRIAEWLGGKRYAPKLLAGVQAQLARAEGLYAGKGNRKQVAMASREVVQNAEDVRLVAAGSQQDEEAARALRSASQRRRR